MKKTLIVMIAVVLLMTSVIGASGFVDVQNDAYYAEAVQWAKENGITFGTDATHFSPDKPITRAEMITFLWRMSQQEEAEEAPATTLPVYPEPTTDPTPASTPKPTPAPRTLADLEYQVPEPCPTIVPEYQSDYYGRMYIGDTYSVGLYDTLDQKLVDASDAAFIMKMSGCYMVGDHDSEGLWIIRWCGPGDTMKIIKQDGTVELYEWQKTDAHVRNKGSDVWDDDGNSCFKLGYDLFIATCNDSEGIYMTATYWNKVEVEP